jgi:hypothetical protein
MLKLGLLQLLPEDGARGGRRPWRHKDSGDGRRPWRREAGGGGGGGGCRAGRGRAACEWRGAARRRPGGATTVGWRGSDEAASGRRAMAGRDGATCEWRRAARRRAAGESGEIERVRGKSAAVLGLLPTKQSLPSARSRALGKDFFKIKKYTLSSAFDLALGKGFFAECLSVGTRQRLDLGFLKKLCRVPHDKHLAKLSLPSVQAGALSKINFNFFILFMKLFVVCSYTM